MKDLVTDQLKVWEGEFGDAYTDRNEASWRNLLPAFEAMLGGLPIRRALEVGCNRGHNLLAIAEVLEEGGDIVGIDPNRHSLEFARKASSKVSALYGHVYDLPFKDNYFDLVVTVGVLIHVHLDDLPRALQEIHRVTGRYILVVEYFAEEETVIPYRGRTDLLWKRNFLVHYTRRFPELVSIRTGFWGPEHGFDRTHWWLLEKTGQAIE